MDFIVIYLLGMATGLALAVLAACLSLRPSPRERPRSDPFGQNCWTLAPGQRPGELSVDYKKSL